MCLCVQAESFNDGYAVADGPDKVALANVDPDKQQYKVVARLLLHPNPSHRYTVDQALNDEFVWRLDSWNVYITLGCLNVDMVLRSCYPTLVLASSTSGFDYHSLTLCEY